MNGVHQDRAGPALLVELVQICTVEHKGGYVSLVEADAGQVAAARQQVSTQEDIGGLVLLDGDHLLC